MKKCFVNKPRYITRGVSQYLPMFLQIHLWGYIDVLSKQQELDYLQVFELEKQGRILKIIHSQEIPKYEKMHEIVVTDSVQIHEKKIFVIDSGSYATMLFASEY